jgi:hypothetical protein
MAAVTATIDFGLAEDGICPGVIPAEPDDGSIVMEGTSCSLIVSSPTTSSTFCLECLGFGELVLKIREKGEISI